MTDVNDTISKSNAQQLVTDYLALVQNVGPSIAGLKGLQLLEALKRDPAEIPFYVGQTNRLLGRMNDYRLANFTACTHFCVGEAIRYLRSKHYQIRVRYNPSPDPPRQEKAIIRRLLVCGVWLVNCLPRYEYRTATETDERLIVQRFCEMFTGKTKSGEFYLQF